MPLSVEDPEVERLAVEAARLTGESKTESIRKALEERVSRLRMVKRYREASLLRYLQRVVWPRVPLRALGRKLTRLEADAVLGYGKDGV